MTPIDDLDRDLFITSPNLQKILTGLKIDITTQNLGFNYPKIVDERISVIPAKHCEPFIQSLVNFESPDIRAKNGQFMKPGKFLTKLCPEATFQTIHKFMASLQGNQIEIVAGGLIRDYYLETSYSREETGTLGNSCMRHSRQQDYMDIYVDNAKMAILKDLDQKLIGRAIIWEARDENNQLITVLDRIYGTDKTQEKFKIWAKKQKFYYKLRQTFSNNNMVTPDDSQVNPKGWIIQLKKANYAYYPYLDTFSSLDVLKCTLSTASGDIELRELDGSYKEEHFDTEDEDEDEDEGEPVC